MPGPGIRADQTERSSEGDGGGRSVPQKHPPGHSSSQASVRVGVENELVPATIYQALQAVKSLKAGRTEARESIKIRAVDQGTVDDTLPHLSRVVADMCN